MPVSADRFREVLGRLASGVCVVTTRDAGGLPHGMTATAVCAVSIEPPLVLACIGSGSRTHDAIQRSGCFAVNLLGAGGAAIADTFASTGEAKFEDVESRDEITGAPVLDAALGYCDCQVVDRVTAGDHTVFIGRVESASAIDSTADTLPLLHYRSSYATVVPSDRGRGKGGGRAGDDL